MQDNKSILYITNHAGLGGVSKYLLEIVSSLPENLTPYFVMAGPGYFTEELKKIGIKDEQIFFVPMTNNINDFSTHIKSYINIFKIIHKIKPNIIHANTMTAGIAGRISGALSGVPVIYTVHGWTFSSGLSKFKTWFYIVLEVLLAFLTKKIICICDSETKIGHNLLPFAKNKIINIKNGISDIPDEFRKHEFSENELKLVMICRYTHPKNPYPLIQAVSELVKEGYNIKLDLYGYGEELDNVLDCIKNQNTDNIRYKGEISDVTPILKNYDVFALISKKEGLPISVLEAMRCGLPLLLTDVGGMTELVINNGFLVPSNDYKDCKKQIKKMWDNRGEIAVWGQNSRKLFEEEFTAEKMTDKTNKLYEEYYEV